MMPPARWTQMDSPVKPANDAEGKGGGGEGSAVGEITPAPTLPHQGGGGFIARRRWRYLGRRSASVPQ